MPTITQLTPNSFGRIADWYERAFNTPEVVRFLTMSRTVEIPTSVDTDWSHIILMDAGGHGLAKIAPARSSSNFYCDLGCWVLPTAGDQKKMIAGALLQRAFEISATRFGSKYVDWMVHETNADSLKFSRRRAQQVGACPEGAWDNALGEWVTQYTFRNNVEQYRKGKK